MVRLNPYKTSSKKMSDYLNMNLFIPMNQREYSWTDKEIKLVLEDLKQIFEDKKYVERMGSIIVLRNANGYYEIYDGQQRTITIILTLYAIGDLIKILLKNNEPNWAISDLAIVPRKQNPNEFQKKIREKIKFKDCKNLVIPKIYCISPNDNDAIIEIFNNLFNPCWKYLDNTYEFIENNIFQIYKKEKNIVQQEELDNELDNESSNDNLTNVDDDDNSNDDIITNAVSYICNICKQSNSDNTNDNTNDNTDNNENNNSIFTSKKLKDFQNHLLKVHKKNDITILKTSKIYNAYLAITEFLINCNYNLTILQELYQFILNDIEIQFYESDDPVYVSKIFEWENNRGTDLGKLDLVKNPILTRLKDEQKTEIYDEWEKLKKRNDDVYNDYGQKLFDIAIQIFNGEFKRKVENNDFDKLISASDYNGDTYLSVKEYFAIIEKLHKIFGEIKTHRYGKLLNKSKDISLSWEAYMWCMLPIFYIRDKNKDKNKTKDKKNLDNDLIKLFTKYYFRNLPYGTTTLNSLKYSGNFIKIINETYKELSENNKYDYYAKYKEILKENIDIKLHKENYINHVKSYRFRDKAALYMLMFLETCESPDNVIIDLEDLKLTLEHIFPKKMKDTLQIKDALNYIGNLTLLQRGNSENGHKGNCSLGCKPYEDKKQSYQESRLILTADIVRHFSSNVFGENEIKRRTELIANLIEKNTRYFN